MDDYSLLPRIERLLQDYENIRNENNADHDLVGTLNVASIGSAVGLLAQVVLKMQSRYPRLTINVVMTFSTDPSLHIKEDELDAALSVKSPFKLSEDVLWTELYDEPFVFIASHTTKNYGSIEEALSNRPFLRLSRRTRTGALVEQLIRKHGYQVNELMELNSLRAIVELVQRDVGVSIIPMSPNALHRSDPLLHIVPFPDTEIRRHIGLFEDHRRGHLTSVLRRLLREEIINS